MLTTFIIVKTGRVSLVTTLITVLSSLEAFARDAVLARLEAVSPHLGTVRYDVLAPDRAHRSVFRRGLCLQRQALPSGYACLAGAVSEDLRQLLDDPPATAAVSELVVALPPGVSAHAVLEVVARLDPAYTTGIAPSLSIRSVRTAIDPDTLDETLWSSSTLADRGIAVADGELEAGAFVVGELLACDVYTLVLDTGGGSATRLGVELAQHIAPQAVATLVGPRPGWLPPLPYPTLELGGFDDLELTWRTAPGSVAVPVQLDSGLVRTHVARVERPLHPQRLSAALQVIAAGCVWTRGRVWIASVADRRIAWVGVGPNIGFEDGGRWLADRPPAEDGDDTGPQTQAVLDWHPLYQDRGTVLAFSGDEVDGQDIDAILATCALTDEELAQGFDGWRHLPDPMLLEQSFS